MVLSNLGHTYSDDGKYGSRRGSSQGLMSPSEASAPASPGSAGADTLLPATPAEVLDPHQRGLSSSSSTMTLKRSLYASSVHGGHGGGYSSASTSSLGGARRESYLPHSPMNRNQIQIVPPQPLGFGTGGMAMATDQRTLAFSKTSGVGSGEEFGSGLVWEESSGEPKPAGPAATSPGLAPAPALIQEQRKRYLKEGPGPRMNHSKAGSSASSSRQDGARLYAGTSGSRSPDRASSRSYSNTPSVSEHGELRQGSSPRTVANGSSHPLHPSNPGAPGGSSTPGQSSRQFHGSAFTSQQSPLQLMSSSGWEDGEPASPRAGFVTEQNHSRHPSEAGTAATGEPGSPILGAFRPATPGLASRSGSGTGSHSSPTGPFTDSSGRPSASGSAEDVEQAAADVSLKSVHGEQAGAGRSVMIGPDGRLQVIGGEDGNAQVDQKQQEAATGWRGFGISALMGRS